MHDIRLSGCFQAISRAGHNRHADAGCSFSGGSCDFACSLRPYAVDCRAVGGHRPDPVRRSYRHRTLSSRRSPANRGDFGDGRPGHAVGLLRGCSCLCGLHRAARSGPDPVKRFQGSAKDRPDRLARAAGRSNRQHASSPLPRLISLEGRPLVGATIGAICPDRHRPRRSADWGRRTGQNGEEEWK